MNPWMKSMVAGAAAGIALAALGAEPATVAPNLPPKPSSAATMEPAVSTPTPSASKVVPTDAKSVPRTRGVQDRLELDATQITGNRELPRVMYVVPWKRADLGDLTGRPVNSLLDEVLAPVDRSVFQRQNRYYDALRPDASALRPEGEK
ncbi:MAG: hypothetical protein RL030_33 [Pseudomonadota bacterium]